ncbi:MAG: hypothetical protein AAF390_13720 [Pseudomonadota bacterium]
MIRVLLPLALLLTGCVQTGASNGFSSGEANIAAQRMRFAVEAVCLNNRTRNGQDQAARQLSFPIREREGSSVVYANPGTLTFLRIGPAPEQAITTEAGRIVINGSGCSVGSPAVGQAVAQRLAGEILAPRLVDGSDTLRAPIAAGRNSDGGIGFFFEGLSVTLPPARTTFTDPATGQGIAFDHPVILIVHN